MQSADHSRCAAIVGSPTWRPQGEARAIPEGVRDASAVDARLREDGQCLLAWDPPAHRLLVGTLAPFELALRDRLAGVLKRSPWEVRLSTRWGLDPDTGAGVLVEVILPNAPVLAEDAAKARERWTAIAQGTVGGHSGWRAELDGLTQTVTLTAGAEMNLPERAEPEWELMDGLPRETLAFATDGFSQPVTIDLATNGGSLVAGKQGSGKSVLLQVLLYGALVSELDIAIVDPVKGGSDFAVFEPFVRPGGWGCESYDEALAVVEGVYAEGLRRKALHKKYGVGKWSELPPEVIAAENIRPIFLVVDEATSLVQSQSPWKPSSPSMRVGSMCSPTTSSARTPAAALASSPSANHWQPGRPVRYASTPCPDGWPRATPAPPMRSWRVPLSAGFTSGVRRTRRSVIGPRGGPRAPRWSTPARSSGLPRCSTATPPRAPVAWVMTRRSRARSQGIDRHDGGCAANRDCVVADPQK